MDLDPGEAPTLRCRLGPSGRGDQVGQRLRPQALLVADAGARVPGHGAGEEDALRPVPVDAVARGVRRGELVDRRGLEVQPQPVVLQAQGALPGHDDLVAIRLRALIGELQEDAFERTAVRSHPVEEEGDARTGLAERAGRDDVDDRSRCDPGHALGQTVVGPRKDGVVDDEDAESERSAGGEQGPVDVLGADPAGPQGHQLRVRGEPAHADEDGQEERHRQRQDDDPGNRQDDHPCNLGERGRPADEEVRQQEDRPHEKQEGIGGKAQEEWRPDLAEGRA